MAIYSLSVSSVGRSTHVRGTAGAHVSYITRNSAAVAVIGANMPVAPNEARAWLDQAEVNDRRNARVVTKITLALPAELPSRQHTELVTAFATEITIGRASWLAAIHRPPDAGDDRNHHAHLIVRDRDPSGRTVCGMTEKGSVARMRDVWERVANATLEMAGVGARVDRRTLAAQGIERQPGIHIGVAGTAIHRSGRVSDRAEIHAEIREFNFRVEQSKRAKRQIEELERELEFAKAERLKLEEEGCELSREKRGDERDIDRSAPEAAAGSIADQPRVTEPAASERAASKPGEPAARVTRGEKLRAAARVIFQREAQRSESREADAAARESASEAAAREEREVQRLAAAAARERAEVAARDAAAREKAALKMQEAQPNAAARAADKELREAQMAQRPASDLAASPSLAAAVKMSDGEKVEPAAEKRQSARGEEAAQQATRPRPQAIAKQQREAAEEPAKESGWMDAEVASELDREGKARDARNEKAREAHEALVRREIALIEAQERAKNQFYQLIQQNRIIQTQTPEHIKIVVGRDDLEPFSENSTSVARIVRYLWTDQQRQDVRAHLTNKGASATYKVPVAKIREIIDAATDPTEVAEVFNIIDTAFSDTVGKLAGRDKPGANRDVRRPKGPGIGE